MPNTRMVSIVSTVDQEGGEEEGEDAESSLGTAKIALQLPGDNIQARGESLFHVLSISLFNGIHSSREKTNWLIFVH